MSQRTLFAIDVLADRTITFAEQFQQLLEAENLAIEYDLLDGIAQHEQLPLLPEQEPLGIIISGSVHSTYERLPWMLSLEQMIQKAYDRDIPVFGICFGHQMIAQALGCTVEKHAKTREFGTHSVHLKPEAEHPYLRGFDSGTLTAQTHQDHVTVLPPGAMSLGFSQITPHQILSVGSCFGVQFHPEYTWQELRKLGQVRQPLYLKEALFHSEEHLKHYLETLGPTPTSRVVLANLSVP